ncbi:hypothetical protein HHK36_007173 [Tetracentron sinense]|uniref:AAA+ ATPase domain-containing protein n=1 Tax=Tetracentron sinense TaxID=13715 RepID=A0A835DL03_TETSI|nr:hypothetical protein HHK36_007173 [Tetracentron sinense]
MTPATMGEMWATMGSTLAGFMFVWAIVRQYFPYELRRHLEKYTHRLISFAYPYIRISIHEFTGSRMKRSEAYAAVEAYLSVNSSKSAKKLKAEMGKDSSNLVLSMDEHERVEDEYKGVKLWWALSKIASSAPRSMSYYPEPERRYYRLTFHKRHRELISGSYLEYVVKEGKAIKVKNRQRKLFTNSAGNRWSIFKHTMWSHISFEHPATFETLAMDPEKKREIIEDLQTFSKSKDYYMKIGKAWKRGYLLYGPPGTGKSTMIAAMANLLGYDIYDLELTAVKDNTELRKLFIETTSRSIIVIEDIDCCLDLTGQRKKKSEKSSEDDDQEKGKKNKEPKEDTSSKVTLSGLLNFIDGLWSACGGERLIVFTTNYKEKLDPALIRRGRMDKHIELSYCSFEGFKVFAKNYLDLDSHPMFDTIQQLMLETNITPADVAENLMPKSPTEDVKACLLKLVQALEETKEEAARLRALEEAKEEASRLKPKKGPKDGAIEEAKEEATSLKAKEEPKDGALEEAKEEATSLKTKEKPKDGTIEEVKEEATNLKGREEPKEEKSAKVDTTQVEDNKPIEKPE